MAQLRERYATLIEKARAQAISELEDLARRDPGDAEALELLCLAYMRSLDFENCARVARALLDRRPGHPVAQRQFAISQLMLADDAAALAAWRAVHDARPSRVSLLTIGVLLHRLGHMKDAREAFRALLSLADGDEARASALFRLVRLERDAGDANAANDAAVALLRLQQPRPTAIPSFIVKDDEALGHRLWYALSDKARLAGALNRWGSVEPGGRFPPSFTLPDDAAGLAAYAQTVRDAVFIAKPIRGSGGQGIELSDDVAALLGRDGHVVQRYIGRPFLAGGHKGHIRLYLLATSSDPVRAYLLDHGIVRLAPAPYRLAGDGRFDVAMHVTNTALHAGDPRLSLSQDEGAEDQGHVWSLNAYLRRFEEAGGDTARARSKLRDLASWFVRILAREGVFSGQASGPARAYAPKLFGLDVVFDADGDPWLIEMQAIPGVRGTPLVNRITGEMFRTIGRMTVGAFDAATPEAIAGAEADHEAAQATGFSALRL